MILCWFETNGSRLFSFFCGLVGLCMFLFKTDCQGNWKHAHNTVQLNPLNEWCWFTKWTAGACANSITGNNGIIYITILKHTCKQMHMRINNVDSVQKDSSPKPEIWSRASLPPHRHSEALESYSVVQTAHQYTCAPGTAFWCGVHKVKLNNRWHKSWLWCPYPGKSAVRNRSWRETSPIATNRSTRKKSYVSSKYW